MRGFGLARIGLKGIPKGEETTPEYRVRLVTKVGGEMGGAFLSRLPKESTVLWA